MRTRATVVDFDEPAGYGTIRSTMPANEFFFHCTAISDGSRTIDLGTP